MASALPGGEVTTNRTGRDGYVSAYSLMMKAHRGSLWRGQAWSDQLTALWKFAVGNRY